ncbi:MAG: hypothetical protein SCK57_11015, partial [Bacillota bacterium]|nr:hypothetical protein [Bacillota bacterium]
MGYRKYGLTVLIILLMMFTLFPAIGSAYENDTDYGKAVDLTIGADEDASWINGGYWTQWRSEQSSGTGRFNTYLSLQAGQTGIERGYNSDRKNKDIEYDEKPQTRSLLLSDVPLVQIDGEGIWYREFAFDVNQTAGNPHLSVDLFQIWQTDDKDLVDDGTFPVGDIPDFEGNAELVYEIDGHYVIVDYNIGNGSGWANYLVLVPNEKFDPELMYVVFFAQHGAVVGPADNGFTEWGVQAVEKGCLEINKQFIFDGVTGFDPSVPFPGTLTVHIEGTSLNGNFDIPIAADGSGSRTWCDLMLGAYTISEVALNDVPLGDEWVVDINPSPANVLAKSTTVVNITNTLQSGCLKVEKTWDNEDFAPDKVIVDVYS